MNVSAAWICALKIIAAHRSGSKDQNFMLEIYPDLKIIKLIIMLDTQSNFF